MPINLSVRDKSKDLLLAFDGGVTSDMTLNNFNTPVVKEFPTPYITSSKVKLTVLTIYDKVNNGFGKLAVWTPHRKQI